MNVRGERGRVAEHLQFGLLVRSENRDGLLLILRMQGLHLLFRSLHGEHQIAERCGIGSAAVGGSVKCLPCGMGLCREAA